MEGYGVPNVEEIPLMGTIKVNNTFVNTQFDELQREIRQKSMKTLTLLESHQSVGDYYLQCENQPFLSRQDDGILWEQYYKINIPLILDQLYEIKGSGGVIPGVKVTSEAWPLLSTGNGTNSTITHSTTTNLKTSTAFEKSDDGRIFLRIQTKLIVNARLRIENLTSVAPMAQVAPTEVPELILPDYVIRDTNDVNAEAEEEEEELPEEKTTLLSVIKDLCFLLPPD